MNESLVLITTYARMVWRFRWIALAGATLICVAGWVYVMLLPNQYAVSAKVYMDTSSMLKPLLRGIAVDNTVQADSARLISRTLLVRPNLEKVARKTDMDLQAKNPKEFEVLLAGLASAIQISGTKKNNIFQIRYSNSDPKLATRVVEALLNLFVERSLGESRKDSSSTRQFLDTQIKEYEGRLVSAENRLKQFKRKNVGMMPTSGKTYYSRLENAAEERANTELELNEARNGRDELARQLAGVEAAITDRSQNSGTALGESDIPHALDGRIDALEKVLDQLLLRYTERHPDVVAGRDQIAQMTLTRDSEVEDKRKELATIIQSGGVSQAQVANPLYQELKVQLGATRAMVASLEARLEEHARRENSLKKLVDTVPKIEAELVRLNRDYAIDTKNYEQLVSRREQLKIADDASQTTDDVRFNVIEPPREPLVPVSPNRPFLNSAVIAAGVGGGIGLALLVALLRPGVYTRDGLAQLTNMPVLGVVGRIWTPRERFRRRLEVASFGAGCVGLVGLYAGIVLLESLSLDLMTKLRDLGEQLL
ncbi:MAG: polysaccharide chain length determinant protein (PEP-CTERM system associated) [Gammaproteobacteria bacterium]|jgi:polysaccharide chain length determinant protein (PEP-CTERM system associated)